jgi:hypothetical protein
LPLRPLKGPPQITDKLFGNDVVDKIKGLSEGRKMAALVTYKTLGDRNNEFSGL